MSEHEVRAEATREDEGRAKTTVLVGEDSAVVREVLRWHLEAHRFHVVECDDGADAVRLAEQFRPSVILLGIELPTLDGYQALVQLKANPDLRDTPVVFLTAHTDTEALVEGLRLGAHDYLCKPFEPAEVIARVRAAARVKQLQDDLRARNAELDRIARSDSLTGLANRRHIDERLAAYRSAARRHGHPLSLAIVDVDRFKSINDTHGHATGDAVLREVARRLVTAARGEDLVGRWGGEEFVVILPHCPVDDALAVCERIRRTVEAESIGVDGEAIDVTVSIGCTTGEDDDLIERADNALYAAKQSGRNRTVAVPVPVAAQNRPEVIRVAGF